MNSSMNSITGLKGETLLEAGYVFAPYIPLVMTPILTLPRITGKPVWDDPVDQLMHEIGYDTPPSRWERPQFQSITGIVSVQPMTASSTAHVFHLNYNKEMK